MSFTPTPVEDGKDWMRNVERRVSSIERHRHPDPIVDANAGRTPKPPTNVVWKHVNSGTGWAIRTTWDEVLENTDGTAFVPGGYQIEQQLGGKVVFGELKELTPLRPDPFAAKLFDRQGLSYTWMGGEDGQSVYLGADVSLWMWSASSWGYGNGDKKYVTGTMRNSFTTTKDFDRLSTRMFAGMNNLMPADVAVPKTTAGFSVAGATLSAGPKTPDGYDSMTVTPTGTGRWTIHSPLVPVVSATTPFVGMMTGQISGMRLAVQYLSATNAVLVTSAAVSTVAGEQATVRGGLPPAGATRARLWIDGPASTAWISKLGLFATDHAMLSWRPPAKTVEYTNLFTNPDGVRSTPSTTSALALRNQAMNPSFHVNTSSWGVYSGATITRIVASDAWSGEAYGRFTPNTTANRTGLATAQLGAIDSAGLAGKTAIARVRLRAKTVDPASRLSLTPTAYNSGSGNGSAPAVTIPLTSSTEWVTVELKYENLPAGTNQVGLLFSPGGAAWSASDTVDVDGLEIYYGTSTFPSAYFDGSSSPRDGYTFSWAGTAGNSASDMTVSTEMRRNYAVNPSVRTGLTGWSAVPGASLRRDASTTPAGGTGAVTTTVVGAASLAPVQALLAQAATRSVRIGILGDSNMEQAGSTTATNLADRVPARLQEKLRRSYPAPGVKTTPAGYYGHSTNVPANFWWDGPIDPPRERVNDNAKPFPFLYLAFGWAGRFVTLESGHRQVYGATFDVTRVGWVPSIWGRILRVTIDGKVLAEIDTYSDASDPVVQYWTSPSLGSAEHTVVLEFIPRSGVGFEPGDGHVRVTGIELFDGDQAKGVRVYDLSSSGKTAVGTAQPATANTELRDAVAMNLDLTVIHLGHNDAWQGSTATPGGVRSSAAFKTDILTIISKMRTLGYTGAFLLTGAWDRSDATTEPMANYRAKLAEIANADSKVAYIDLTQQMGPVAGNTEGLYFDAVHATKKGLEVVASLLHGALVPSAGPAAVHVTGSTPGVTFSAPGLLGVGKQYTGSVDLLAPAGQEVTLDTAVTGSSWRDAQKVIATGRWQRVALSGAIRSTDGTFPVVRVQSAKPFRVTNALFEQAGQAGEPFDGSTTAPAGHTYSWTGTADASASILSRNVPAGWTVFTGSLALVSTTKVHRSTSSVQLTPAPSGSSGASVNFTPYAGAGSVVMHVLIPAGATVSVRCRDSAGATIADTSLVVTGTGDWQEVRWNNVVDVRYITFNINTVEVHVAEITYVSEASYRGPAFSGRTSSPGAVASWTGAADNSTSKLVLDADVAPSDDKPASLLTASAAGAPAHDYLTLPGAHEKHSLGLEVFATGMSLAPGAAAERNGRTYVAHFDVDAAAPGGYRFTALREWASDGVRWGDSAMVSGSFLYVFGFVGGSVVVCRTPAGNVMGARQVWRNGGWNTPASGAPTPIATVGAGSSGWTGMRVFDGRWVALSVDGQTLRGWTASSPTGPWADLGSLQSLPTGGHSVPRWHPQHDVDGVGALISVTRKGELEPVFYRTPAGQASSSYDAEVWGDRISTESLEYVKDVLSVSDPYRVRVRAVNIAGVPSDWVVGSESPDAPPEPVVPRPSAPVVTSFFRGGRVLWDGLTDIGDSYEGFVHYEVHVGSTSTFVPNGWTREDVSTLPGGVSTVFSNEWERRYVRIVVVTRAGRSAPSAAVHFDPERLSDAALAGVLIENAKLGPKSVSASNLAVSAFSNSLVPNGNLEDVVPLSSPEMPVGWRLVWPRGPRDWNVEPWGNAGSMVSDASQPIAGARSMLIRNTAETSRQAVSDSIPVTPGDIYYVALKLRTDTMAGDVQVSFVMGAEEDDVNAIFNGADSRSVTLFRTGGSRTAQTFEAQVEVPDKAGDGSGVAMRFGAVAIETWATGAPYGTWIDDIEVRRVTGSASIANASINRAKIAQLAVDDARIASMGVGKLVSGYVMADMILGSRIMSSVSGTRTEQNKYGFFGYNPFLTGSETIPVTELRSDNGALISRWLRTNTDGTRIEMGTYGMGANSALMSFYPASGDWQFPPAFGYGGGTRQGTSTADQKYFMTKRDGQNVPGLAMHAGSISDAFYRKYGMNMIGVDQVGGIALVTGNLLAPINGETQATTGSPIMLNAGGVDSYIDLLSGGGTDPSRLRLDPRPFYSFLSLNRGMLKFLDSSADRYYIRFVDSAAYGWDVNHINVETNFGGFRVSNASSIHALTVKGTTVKSAGDMVTSGDGLFERDYLGVKVAARLRTSGDSSIEFDKYGNAYTNMGQDRAHTAFYVNGDGLMDGGGDWGTPKIKVRGMDPKWISWDAAGNAHINGTFVKTFVIPHPVDEDRLLVHAAHEGDDMRVVYEGVGRTEGRETTIVLPDYFEALTEPETDVVLVSALLCAHDQCVCAVKAGRVQGDRFRVVAQGTSHEVDFSWRVTAVRRGTRFEVEPRRDEVQVRGEGPYTYLAPR